MQLRIVITILILMLFQASIHEGYAKVAFGDDPLLKKAKADYEMLRFSSAIKHLKLVLKKEPRNVLAKELLAGSYRHVRDYEQALFWYSELCKQTSVKPEWVLYYAEALANKEKYEESEQWYRKYQRLVPSDQRSAAFVKAGIVNLPQDKGEWKVSATNINTPASEYSPMYYNGGLLFSSNRKKKSLLKYVFGWDQTPFSDLYVIEFLEDIHEKKIDNSSESIRTKDGYKFNDDDTELSSNDSRTLGNLRPDGMSTKQSTDMVNAKLLKGKINSRFHEGSAVLLPEGSLIFTRNNFFKGKARSSQRGINKLKLYTAGGVNLNKIVSFRHNSDEYSVGHPAISVDGNTLIFVSDMPGSFGGTDLYYSRRSSAGKPWAKPVNMGRKINTEGNEQFPFWDKSGKLFFSSTGHAGFGGLDIFEATFKNMKPVAVPRNLGVPFNSSADDFGFIRSDDENSGYFSSNREGNDDIYSYKRLFYSVSLKGIVIDSKTDLPLIGAKVLLRHSMGIDTLLVNSKGQFSHSLNKETEYHISGRKPNYVSNSTLKISTKYIEKDTVINVVLKLDKPEVTQQFVLNNCDSLKRVFAVKNIYYDLDKWDIREDSHKALEELTNLMKVYPNMKIITSSHTDSRATNQYNRILSLRRGQSAKKYLISKGIDGSRIQVGYFGKSRLVNHCVEDVICSEEEQQLNRRTEFDIVLNGINLTELNCKD